MDLLEYAMTHDLTDLIEKNWERFKPIFDDMPRTREYFRLVKDIRNTIAHNRALLPFERDLVSGIAGHLANQVALYLGSASVSGYYYPVIESATDSFGQEGNTLLLVTSSSPTSGLIRVDVGETVRLSARAISARGRPLHWRLHSPSTAHRTHERDPDTAYAYDFDRWTVDVGRGEVLEYDYTFAPGDVSEYCELRLYLASESKYHRNPSGDYGQSDGPFDDHRRFYYAVNPPEEE
ncbi:hypothetical protein [Georgenia wangjunii]|uniref:hypothetical protein n=1 Tax=Georgenia wangjunii TaxID=3117730 RepID=UPI002F260898